MLIKAAVANALLLNLTTTLAMPTTGSQDVVVTCYLEKIPAVAHARVGWGKIVVCCPVDHPNAGYDPSFFNPYNYCIADDGAKMDPDRLLKTCKVDGKDHDATWDAGSKSWYCSSF